MTDADCHVGASGHWRALHVDAGDQEVTVSGATIPPS